MDIFIPYGGPQNFNGEELRFSLRSIDMMSEGVNNIYITEDCPSWVRNVRKINVTDSTEDPALNVQKKLLAFCNTDSASDEFLFWHDDFIALKPFVAQTLPFYAKTTGQGGLQTPQNFAVHFPVRYHRTTYKQLYETNPLIKGVSPRSFYLNFMQAPATEAKEFSPKIGDNFPPLEEQAKDHNFVAFNNRAVGHEQIKEWLEDMFPYPSKYE